MIVRQPSGVFEWGKALRAASGVPLSVRGAAMTLATWADPKTGERIYPSLSGLADDMGLDRSGLSRAVAQAVALGWLEMVENNGRSGRPNRYRLTIPTG